jgi:hypothetical protein
MRFIFGIIIGIVLTVGAAYVHDTRVASGAETNPNLAPPEIVGNGEIVNWDTLGRVTQEQLAFIRRQFNKLVGDKAG